MNSYFFSSEDITMLLLIGDVVELDSSKAHGD